MGYYQIQRQQINLFLLILLFRPDGLSSNSKAAEKLVFTNFHFSGQMGYHQFQSQQWNLFLGQMGYHTFTIYSIRL